MSIWFLLDLHGCVLLLSSIGLALDRYGICIAVALAWRLSGFGLALSGFGLDLDLCWMASAFSWLCIGD